MSKYISASTIQKTYEVSTATLRRWDEEKKVEAVRGPGGKRLYNADQINQLFQKEEGQGRTKTRVCYARVSSEHQRGDLERQIEDLRKACPGREILSDIGSGVNFKRRNFQRLLERAFEGDIEEIAITYKDRLCRIGYDLVEFMLSKLGVKIKVMVPSESPETEGDSTKELADDLLSIVTVFVARYHGQRAAENKRRRKRERATQEEDQEERKKQKGSTSREDNHNSSLSRQAAEGNIDEMAGDSQMDL
jgi:predicted site-specific integrase-resolvase